MNIIIQQSTFPSLLVFCFVLFCCHVFMMWGFTLSLLSGFSRVTSQNNGQRGKCQALKPHHLPILLPTTLWGTEPSVLTSPPLPLPCPGPGGHLMLSRKVHLAQSPLLAPGLALEALDLITGPSPRLRHTQLPTLLLSESYLAPGSCLQG